MPRKRKTPTYITLEPNVHRMARMAAARRGITVSDYIGDLVATDCRSNGIAALVSGDPKQEVPRGR